MRTQNFQVLLVLAVLFLAPSLAAAGPGANAFSGNVKVERPILLRTGTLSLPGPQAIDLTQPVSTVLQIEAASLAFDVLRFDEQGILSSDAPTTYLVKDALVEIRAQPGNKAYWRGLAPSPELEVLGGSSCSVTRPPTASKDAGNNAVNDALAGDAEPDRADPTRAAESKDLEVRCRLGKFDIRGLTQLTLLESDVRILSARDPAIVNMTWSLGLIESMEGAKPSSTVLVARIPTGDTATMELTSLDHKTTIEAVFRLPALGFAGRIEIPASKGRVAWGDWNAIGAVPALTPSGTFKLMPAAESSIQLDGVVTNAAPQIVSKHASSLPPSKFFVMGIAGLGLISLLGRIPWIIGFFFSRLVGADILQNETRRLIVEAVKQNPGMGLRELSRLLSVSRSAVHYHVGVLQGAKLVRIITQGKRRRIFSMDLNHREFALEELRKDPINARLIQALAENGDQSQEELARRIGSSQPVVSRRLKTLRRLGLCHVPIGPSLVLNTAPTVSEPSLRVPGFL